MGTMPHNPTLADWSTDDLSEYGGDDNDDNAQDDHTTDDDSEGDA